MPEPEHTGPTRPPFEAGSGIRSKYERLKEPEKGITEIVKDFERFTQGLDLERHTYKKGEIILEERVRNDELRVILEGEAEMSRLREDGQRVYVDTVKAGSFIGLLSFWSDATTFTQTRARTNLVCMSLNRQRFQELALEHPHATLALQTLLANSLASRYRHMAMLNIEVHHLGEQLEAERNQLRETIQNLKDTREQLVGKERLALLGKLLAGIAHEINNPSAVLQQSVENLITSLPGLFGDGCPLRNHPAEEALLHDGMLAHFLGGSDIRKRLKLLEATYPHLDRPFLRRLVPLGEQGLARLHGDLKAAKNPDIRRRIEDQLAFFDIGVNLNSANLSNQRISKLIKSLKLYSRPVDPDDRSLSAREIIQNTLTVLNHRLKHYEVEVDLDALPGHIHMPSDINQVISNIIINACDATPEGGRIHLEAFLNEPHQALSIEITDSGTGISTENLRKIFEPNFTTKSSGGQFGLGLGLAISRDIVERHGGTIEADNRQQGGARFTLRLPVRPAPRC